MIIEACPKCGHELPELQCYQDAKGHTRYRMGCPHCDHQALSARTRKGAVEAWDRSARIHTSRR